MAGASLNDDGNYDMIVTKYNGSTEVWTRTWNGSAEGDDYAADVLVDGSGNVYIAGASYIGSVVNYDAVVVKYNSSGTLQWSSSYSGGASLGDGYVSIEKDNSGNVYACGGTQTTTEQTNILTVKYNSSGTQQWASTCDYADLQELATVMVISGSSVRVSGGSQNDADDWSMATISYNTSSGSQESANRTGGDDEGIDKVLDAATDGTNTYVVGSVMNSNRDWKVIKLNSSLTVTWSATYNGADDLDDEATNVKVDASGNVYVTGWTVTDDEGKNFVTRKYNSSGTVQWTKTFDGQGGDDEGLTLELDNTANVLVSGSSYKDGNLDYLTIKYNYSTGAEIWQARFNSDYNDDDMPGNIALDASGNVYVIGTVGKGDGTTTYMLCKYVIKTVYMPVPVDGFSENGYTSNRGQLRSTNGTNSTGIKYYCNHKGPSIYIDDSKVSYLLAKLDTSSTDSLHRIDMKFNKGNGAAKVYGFRERNEYANYFMGYMETGAPRTPIYNTMVKFDVYTNTDVIYTNNAVGYRHWIVARTGAPTGDFEMQYDGQSSLSVNGSGALVIGTSLGDIVQEKATVYTMNNTSGVLTLLGWQPSYSISSGNKVSFTNLGSWSGTLVIEMQRGILGGGGFPSIANLGWSTYFGGSGYDENFAVDNDDDGNIYVCGATTSQNFPVTVGAQQGSQLGDQNAHFEKFFPNHQEDYISYFGGAATSCYGNDIVVSPDGQFLYLVGYTDAAITIAEVDGASNEINLNSQTDGYIARFDANGVLYWSRYFGGNGIDVITSIALAPGAEFFITGSTSSSSASFPLQSSGDAYYQGIEMGGHDAFVARFNPELHLDWCTRYGGSSVDVGDHCMLDITGHLYVVGHTFSANFHTENNINAGLFDSTLGGDEDDFLLRFENNGEIDFGSYVGGNGSETNFLGQTGTTRLTATYNQLLYMVGSTYSTDLPSVFSSASWVEDEHAGGLDGYILEINPTTHSVTRASYWGGSEDDQLLAVIGNLDNGIFITGTSSSSDVTTIVPSGYYDETLTSGSDDGDCIVSHWKLSAGSGWIEDWRTLFGGTSNQYGDYGLDFAIVGNNLYLVGSTDSYENGWGDPDYLFPLVDPGDPGYFESSYGGDDYECFVSLFDIDILTSIDPIGQTLSEGNSFMAFPSPARDFTILQFDSFTFEDALLKVYDQSGKCVNHQRVRLKSGKNDFSLNLSAWCDGIYTCVLISEAQYATTRLTVLR